MFKHICVLYVTVHTQIYAYAHNTYIVETRKFVEFHDRVLSWLVRRVKAASTASMM